MVGRIDLRVSEQASIVGAADAAFLPSSLNLLILALMNVIMGVQT